MESIPLDFDGDHSVLRQSSVYYHEPSPLDFIGSMCFFPDYSFASEDPDEVSGFRDKYLKQSDRASVLWGALLVRYLGYRGGDAAAA